MTSWLMIPQLLAFPLQSLMPQLQNLLSYSESWMKMVMIFQELVLDKLCTSGLKSSVTPFLISLLVIWWPRVVWMRKKLSYWMIGVVRLIQYFPDWPRITRLEHFWAGLKLSNSVIPLWSILKLMCNFVKTSVILLLVGMVFSHMEKEGNVKLAKDCQLADQAG